MIGQTSFFLIESARTIFVICGGSEICVGLAAVAIGIGAVAIGIGAVAIGIGVVVILRPGMGYVLSTLFGSVVYTLARV